MTTIRSIYAAAAEHFGIEPPAGHRLEGKRVLLMNCGIRHSHHDLPRIDDALTDDAVIDLFIHDAVEMAAYVAKIDTGKRGRPRRGSARGETVDETVRTAYQEILAKARTAVRLAA